MRAVINFGQGEPSTVEAKSLAKIYLHDQGHPHGETGVPSYLSRFVREAKNPGEERLVAPRRVAARYIVWESLARGTGHVAITLEDPEVLDFEYWLDFVNPDNDGFPTLYYKPSRYEDGTEVKKWTELPWKYAPFPESVLDEDHVDMSLFGEYDDEAGF